MMNSESHRLAATILDQGPRASVGHTFFQVWFDKHKEFLSNAQHARPQRIRLLFFEAPGFQPASSAYLRLALVLDRLVPHAGF